MGYSLTINSLPAELHGAGILWLPSLGVLCAADIHFEKGSFFERFATFLPPYDTPTTLDRLEDVITKLKPRRFIALGDSFHDRDAARRMAPDHKERLNTLISSVKTWVWIEGNHDPGISLGVGGEYLPHYDIAGIRFHHMTTTRPENDLGKSYEISGHYHPKTSVTLKGHRMSGACFVRTGRKLILPAFGSYTGGLDIDSKEFLEVAPLADRDVYLSYRERVYLLPRP